MQVPDEVLEIMRELEKPHHILGSGMRATLTLHANGTGSIAFEDTLRRQLIAAVDFDEFDEMLDAARRLKAQVSIPES